MGCQRCEQLTDAVQALEQRDILWREFFDFLNKANEVPIGIAFIHGWRCPREVWKKGADYRQRLGIDGVPVVGGGDSDVPEESGE